jgi:hypothetical protein
VLPDVYDVHVVHLQRRRDRLRPLWSTLGYLSPRKQRFIQAVDGDLVVPDRPWRGSPQSWACAASHELALLRVVGPTLVVEDDVVVPEQFRGYFAYFYSKVPPDWDLLMLGGEHQAKPTPVTEGVVRCRRTARTHAYLVRNSTVAARLIRLIRSCDWHWDAALALAIFAGEFVAYAPDPFMMGVYSSPSSIPDSTPIVVAIG